MRILLTDEPFDAQEALRINLINEVVDHSKLMERADEIATQIVKMPPVAVRMMKEFAIRFQDIPVTEAWRVQTLINSLLTQLTTDGDEGRKAFQEKREPILMEGFVKRRTGILCLIKMIGLSWIKSVGSYMVKFGYVGFIGNIFNITCDMRGIFLEDICHTLIIRM
ncbi:MAG: hypothetical protein CM1200mP15_09980 [Dehalococcoidia bacterium]|nr:MAG: hypothetical protein CM1200mP15_09980 [Dehalococcoidia bacterium]